MGVMYKLAHLKGKLVNWLVFKKNHIMKGENLIINGAIAFQGNGRAFGMGSNCIINSGWRMNPTGGNDKMYIAIEENGHLALGNNVGISNAIIRCCDRISIGDNVIIGSGCRLMDGDFHSVEYQYRMESPDTHAKTAPIEIKEGAFIGAYSLILKGVTIGTHSIVASGSVVTKDIPDGEVWGGNPAQFIRKIQE